VFLTDVKNDIKRANSESQEAKLRATSLENRQKWLEDKNNQLADKVKYYRKMVTSQTNR